MKRFLGATFALFVFLFFYEWLVHGVWLIKTYETTPHLWRSMDEMTAHMPLSLLLKLVLSAWVSFVFVQLYPQGGVKSGLKFGLYFGVFAGILMGSPYLWLPISAELGLSWFGTGVVEWLLGGTILGTVYCRC